MFHKNITDIFFKFNGEKIPVNQNLMSFVGEYRQAKDDMVREFTHGGDVKKNLSEFTARILPIIFSAEDAKTIAEKADKDYEALFYTISPWVHFCLMPIIKRNVKQRKKQLVKYARW